VILEVKDLHKTYLTSSGFGKQKAIQALRGVNFVLNKGETLAIVGESGCGKSTLAKVLLKIEPPTQGQVQVESVDLSDINSIRLSSFVQMVFQDPYSSLNPRKTVFKIIAEPLVVKGEDPEKIKTAVHQVIEKVGLRPEISERYPHMLSGGQRQRVGIARALITQPKMIICDEPVSALDVSVQGQVLNLLLDLQKDFQLSYLFISHDLGVVRFIADRVAVMYLGKIVELGMSEQIFSHPQHPYTQLLLNSTPRWDQTLSDTEVNAGEIPSAMNPQAGCGFYSRCPMRTEICREKDPLITHKKNREVACHQVENS
jgi:oligopeptide/dipeptide ABC transporter ATP-binding protein